MLVIIVLPETPPPAQSEDRDKDWIKVESAIHQKDYLTAEHDILKYVRKHPENKAAYIEGGRIARKYNLPHAGLLIVGRGLGRFPSDTTLLRIKAELMMEKGDLFLAKIILFNLSRKIAFREKKGLLSEIEDQASNKPIHRELSDANLQGEKTAGRNSEGPITNNFGKNKGRGPVKRAVQAREVNALIEEERKKSRIYLLKKESHLNEISSYPNDSDEVSSASVNVSGPSSAEMEKVLEDDKVLKELALIIPPLSTFDQNTNFQQIILPPSLSSKDYSLENESYHLRLTNVDLLYTGGASIESGIAAESPLIWDAVHFQAGTNEYLGAASGQGTTISSYSYAGVDGEGPDDVQFLFDAGNTNGGGMNNAGLYSHMDIPVGPVLIDAQGWYQLPWSSYGQALLLGGLHSGALVTATWNIIQKLSLSGTYEFTYDTLHGSQTPFGYNHNSVITLGWDFLNTSILNLVASYDSQDFASLVSNPSLLVPVLQSSAFWSAGLSSLKQIGHSLVLNGQLGCIYGRFGTITSMAGYQADGGLAWQIAPRAEFYGNISYESMAASYVGPVTTMMYGINIWF